MDIVAELLQEIDVNKHPFFFGMLFGETVAMLLFILFWSVG